MQCHRLTPAMAAKHGYATVEEYKEGVQKKFSLLENGIIQKPSTRLLLINVRLECSRSSPMISPSFLTELVRVRWTD